MSSSFDPLAGGNLATTLLTNRGRTRAWVARHIEAGLKRKLAALLSGSASASLGAATSPCSISLTSWRPRMPVLPLTLLALVEQSIRPASILVWLTSSDAALLQPDIRELFESLGVQFIITDDLGPHKKWLCALEAGITNPFAICDDDIIYPRDWFSSLVAEDRPDAYVGCKCHRMVMGGNGAPLGYSRWSQQIGWDGHPAHDVFVTGCGGAVVHPDRISLNYRDRKTLLATCPRADDIWLKLAHFHAGFPCFKTRYSFPCLDFEGTEASGLAIENVNNSGNDRQMAAALELFDIEFPPPQAESSPKVEVGFGATGPEKISPRPLSINVPILMYHGVFKPGTLLPSYAIYDRQLEKQLELLRRLKYEILTFGQLLQIALGHAPAPAKKTVVLTFDDGESNFAEIVAPMLRRIGMTATMFLIAGRLGKPGYMDAGAVRDALAAGFEPGVHSMNHRPLCKCSENELHEEVFAAKQRLEDKLGLSMQSFCYPYGLYHPGMFPLLAEAGYLGAAAVFTNEPTVTNNPYAMRRIYPSSGDNLLRFRFKLSPLYLRMVAHRDRKRRTDI